MTLEGLMQRKEALTRSLAQMKQHVQQSQMRTAAIAGALDECERWIALATQDAGPKDPSPKLEKPDAAA